MAKSGHFGAVFTQRALWTLRGPFLSSCSVLSDEIRCFKCKNNFLTGSDEKFCPADNPTVVMYYNYDVISTVKEVTKCEVDGVDENSI